MILQFGQQVAPQERSSFEMIPSGSSSVEWHLSCSRCGAAGAVKSSEVKATKDNTHIQDRNYWVMNLTCFCADHMTAVVPITGECFSLSLPFQCIYVYTHCSEIWYYLRKLPHRNQECRSSALPLDIIFLDFWVKWFLMLHTVVRDTPRENRKVRKRRLTRRPACCQSLTGRWRRLEERTRGNCSPKWRCLQLLCRTAWWCSRLDRRATRQTSIAAVSPKAEDKQGQMWVLTVAVNNYLKVFDWSLGNSAVEVQHIWLAVIVPHWRLVVHLDQVVHGVALPSAQKTLLLLWYRNIFNFSQSKIYPLFRRSSQNHMISRNLGLTFWGLTGTLSKFMFMPGTITDILRGPLNPNTLVSCQTASSVWLICLIIRTSQWCVCVCVFFHSRSKWQPVPVACCSLPAVPQGFWKDCCHCRTLWIWCPSGWTW